MKPGILFSLHTTPTSSVCLQSVTPQPFDVHAARVVSLPLQWTLSIQIFPEGEKKKHRNETQKESKLFLIYQGKRLLLKITLNKNAKEHQKWKLLLPIALTYLHCIKKRKTIPQCNIISKYNPIFKAIGLNDASEALTMEALDLHSPTATKGLLTRDIPARSSSCHHCSLLC